MRMKQKNPKHNIKGNSNGTEIVPWIIYIDKEISDMEVSRISPSIAEDVSDWLSCFKSESSQKTHFVKCMAKYIIEENSKIVESG